MVVVGHCGQCVQEVELNRLATWIRDTARSGGLVSSPFCFGLQDAAARDWQSPAVEKRCTPCQPCFPIRKYCIERWFDDGPTSSSHSEEHRAVCSDNLHSRSETEQHMWASAAHE